MQGSTNWVSSRVAARSSPRICSVSGWVVAAHPVHGVQQGLLVECGQAASLPVGPWVRWAHLRARQPALRVLVLHQTDMIGDLKHRAGRVVQWRWCIGTADGDKTQAWPAPVAQTLRSFGEATMSCCSVWSPDLGFGGVRTSDLTKHSNMWRFSFQSPGGVRHPQVFRDLTPDRPPMSENPGLEVAGVNAAVPPPRPRCVRRGGVAITAAFAAHAASESSPSPCCRPVPHNCEA